MTYLQFFNEWFDISYVLLFLLLWLGWHILRSAEQPGNFWSTIFDDEQQKKSNLRVASLFAFAVSSAVLLYLTINTTKNVQDMNGLLWFYGVYMGIWSGAAVVSKALDKWSGTK